MKSLKGTRTEKNLLTAFAGESQARNRYDYFAGQAKKDGYVEMSRAFEEIANQEKEHAKRLFKFLEGGEVEISGAFPAGVIGATYDNLLAAAAGENHEHQHMYPEKASPKSPVSCATSPWPKPTMKAASSPLPRRSGKARCSKTRPRKCGAA